MGANRMGPPCPECGSQVTDVISTRSSAHNDKVRRRSCFCCGHKFYTVQPAEMIADNTSIHWKGKIVGTIDWWDFQKPLSRLLQESE
jgi:C4-type Zn-finger protein